MTTDFHGNGFGNACPHHVANGCAARDESNSVTITTINNAVFIELPFMKDADVWGADEEITAQCWNELSISVSSRSLLKFLKDADGVVYVFAAEDKSRLLLGTLCLPWHVQMGIKRSA